ncbi:hypothetical protein AQ765_13970 [Burkholderia pseudomallei]|nr:hypothetical protein PTBPS01_22785 [Burkholderia pseudomallei]OAB10116.1 hypothetical protein AQ841_28075 [Burkholderia pseudomallei]OMQ86891.1 hypothetical protein AQ715_05810 [Burkholderia pseudomallei]OMR20439.1 hypothetical protein AQ721_19395 [Burkholderia pseudomallei]OMR21787.1 hypothetical protein AQ720_12850 [Burkholderia pseudomallei]
MCAAKRVRARHSRLPIKDAAHTHRRDKACHARATFDAGENRFAATNDITMHDAISFTRHSIRMPCAHRERV